MALSIYSPARIVTCGSLDLFLSDLNKRENTAGSEVFRTTLINSESFFEGTKVGQPDEFDYLVQLDGFSSPKDEKKKMFVFRNFLVGVLPSETVMENVKFYFPDDRGLV